MKISVITPFSRGVRELSQLVRDFRNQLFKDFELIIVRDGDIPTDVKKFMDVHGKDCNIKFTNVSKDMGDMTCSPGTKPRNYGLSVASSPFVCFCDDDDRYSDKYLLSFAENLQENSIVCVQMSCQESRMYKGGNPKRTVLVPEVGLNVFPVICHVGTPCVCLPRKWALEDPWRHEPEHDFRFFKRIVDKHKPQVIFKPGMAVDVDGLVTKNIIDWVSIPPFHRGQ
jgi:glycosyltransferase involved in cell wall biosynthesis